MSDDRVSFIIAVGVASGVVWHACVRSGLTATNVAILVLSSVFWIPELLVRLRFLIFRSINDNQQALEVPYKNIRGKTYKWLYNHKAVNIRSVQKAYGLSDFFWYLLAPAHSIHQEHTESNDVRYKITARLTRKLCNVRKERLEALAVKYITRLFEGKSSRWEASRFWYGSSWSASGEDKVAIVRLRDFFFPVFERIIFEIVFDRELPDELNEVICASAENVINALKGGTFRDMDKRRALTLALERVLRKGGKNKLELDDSISVKEWAMFLQGVFFTTAVVQLSEGLSHIGVALAQHPTVVQQMRRTFVVSSSHRHESHDNEATKGVPSSTTARSDFATAIVNESLRLWPLFGDAHRMTSEDIHLPSDSVSSKDDVRVIPKGSVVIFNYPAFHEDNAKENYGANHNTFDPNRWKYVRARDQNYIPFGVPRNRPCPGKRISQILLRVMTSEMVRHVDVHTCVNHTRSLPDGGLCVLTKRSREDKDTNVDVMKLPSLSRRTLLRIYVIADTLCRSIWQLICGAYMLSESRRLKLAQTFFKRYPIDKPGIEHVAHKPCPTNQSDPDLRATKTSSPRDEEDRSNELRAVSATGRKTSIDAPEPGQGLRLKPVKNTHQKDQHFFREGPTKWMSPFGSTVALLRGAIALVTIGVFTYIWGALAGISTFLVYEILFHAVRFARSLSRFVTTDRRKTMQPRSCRRVCVVGGGLSGVATVKELQAKGHDVVCYEAGSELGGAFQEAYKSCYLSVSNHWMAFSDFPAEEKDRVFWSARQYIAYLYRYAKHFEILDRFRFNTRVVSIVREADDTRALGHRYRVTLSSSSREEIFDAVVVCTGVNRLPNVPSFQGRDAFERSGGQIVHSLEYHDASPFTDKSVVCIGAGESASDIVKEVADVSSACYLSLRRGTSVATKYPMRSQHTNDAFHARVHYYSHPWLITYLFSDLNKKISTMTDIDPVFAMIGKLNLEAGGGMFQQITKNENFVESLCSGKCTKKGGITRLGSDRTVVFEDGSTVRTDIVLCNTGFRRDWGFLKGLPPTVNLSNPRHLFKHMIHPSLGVSLSFVGWVRPAEGGVPALAEAQARYLALLLSGEREIPKDVRNRVAIDRAAEEARFFLVPHLTTLVHYPKLMEELAELIGCVANMPYILFTQPKLWWRLWFGSHQAAVYRLHGTDAKPDVAMEIIHRLPVAWFANPLATKHAWRLFATNVISFLCAPFGIFEPSW